MAMSKDRVVFFLPRRYYLDEMAAYRRKTNNGLAFKDCVNVLMKSFGFYGPEGKRMLVEIMDSNPDGFFIRCRPSQFARFIVYRMEALETTTEGSNGIRDLNPRLETPIKPQRAIAEALGIPQGNVARVLKKLGLTEDEAFLKVVGQDVRAIHDFSRNPAIDEEML